MTLSFRLSAKTDACWGSEGGIPNRNILGQGFPPHTLLRLGAGRSRRGRARFHRVSQPTGAEAPRGRGENRILRYWFLGKMPFVPLSQVDFLSGIFYQSLNTFFRLASVNRFKSKPGSTNGRTSFTIPFQFKLSKRRLT